MGEEIIIVKISEMDPASNLEGIWFPCIDMNLKKTARFDLSKLGTIGCVEASNVEYPEIEIV